jgi:hypothetical protein
LLLQAEGIYWLFIKYLMSHTLFFEKLILLN